MFRKIQSAIRDVIGYLIWDLMLEKLFDYRSRFLKKLSKSRRYRFYLCVNTAWRLGRNPMSKSIIITNNKCYITFEIYKPFERYINDEDYIPNNFPKEFIKEIKIDKEQLDTIKGYIDEKKMFERRNDVICMDVWNECTVKEKLKKRVLKISPEECGELLEYLYKVLKIDIEEIEKEMSQYGEKYGKEAKCKSLL